MPIALAGLHQARGTPWPALIATGVLGVFALVSGKTNELITLSALGAIVMYIASMLSLFRLRRREPGLARPFRAPWYPVTPLVALALSILSLAVIAWFNAGLTLIFAGGFAAAYAYFRLTGAQRAGAAHDALLAQAREKT